MSSSPSLSSSPHREDIELVRHDSNSSSPSPFNSPTISSNTSSRPDIQLSWHNLCFSVEIPKTKKNPTYTRKILNNISGVAKAGQLTAIMGSSGAGKTSLLNLLAHRTPLSSGSIFLNAQPLSSSLAKAYSAYVMQSDLFLETLTPRELFAFAASMKQGRHHLNEPEKSRAHVQQLLEQLEIYHCADVPVGGLDVKKRGLSGGEKKRVAIGIEMVSDPSVLFLDEPTTGLDSLTALHVVSTLSGLAREDGRTILCTLHQPSAEIFGLFDALILMMNGKIIYHGPADSAVSYFSELGYVCPKYSNPADFFMMDVMRFDEQEEADVARFEHLVECYEGRGSGKEKAVSIEGSIGEDKDTDKEHGVDDLLIEKSLVGVQVVDKEEEEDSGEERSQLFKSLQESLQDLPLLDEDLLRHNKLSWSDECKILFKRAWTNYSRQPMNTRMRLGQTLITSLIISLLYLQLGDDQSTITDREGVIFILMMLNMMSAMAGVILTFSLEKNVIFRERAAGMYRISSYYVAKYCSEVPPSCLFPLIFISIAYFAVGFQNKVGNFFLFVLINLATVNTGQAIGVFLAGISPDADSAVAIQPAVLLPLMLFSGIFVDSDNIPVYFKWIEFISPFRYGYRAMLIVEFKDLHLECTDDQYVPVNGVPTCPYDDGNEYLMTSDIHPDELTKDIGILWVLFACWAVIGFIALWKKSS